jgi:hypothetical protein
MRSQATFSTPGSLMPSKNFFGFGGSAMAYKTTQRSSVVMQATAVEEEETLLTTSV